MNPHRPWYSRLGHAEPMLRHAPRWLEVTCALVLFTIALMLFYGVAVYLRFQHWYGRNLGEKATDWIFFGIQALIGAALFGLGLNLLRGVSRRRDGGLFSPAALRTWGVVFALVPVALLLANWRAIFHPHFLLWSVSASVACFLLAARRRSVPGPESDRAPSPEPGFEGRPRPIE